jgi:hypothetical protein
LDQASAQNRNPNQPQISSFGPTTLDYTGPVMKRPVGLILSIVVLGLAALFLLLLTAVMVLAGIHARNQPSISAEPHFVTYLMLAVSVFYAALSVWAILTVIGILRLRSWGRYSILIIGGGFSVLGLLAAVFTLVGRTMFSAQQPQPMIDPHMMTVVFLLLTVFYLFIAAIGIWWLVYFNLRPVRDLFANPSLLSQSTPTDPFSRTPTAIKIIGVFLLLGSVCCLMCAFLPFPAFLFGFIVPLPATHILYLCFAIITAFAGYGLLRLKESARLLTISFLIVGSCNLALVALPWYQARFSQYTTQLTSYIPTIPGQPQVTPTYNSAFYLICVVAGIVVYGVILWLLHRHRAAFKAPLS